MYSVAVGKANATQGAPRRHPNAKNQLILSVYGERTFYHIIQRAAKEHASNVAMVTRKFVEMKKLKQTDRFSTKIFDDSDLDEITYKTLANNILNFGAGLRALGMESVPQLKQGQHFDELKGKFVMVIFEDTCKQWTIACQGAFSQSIVVATCYATLGEAAVIDAVNETNATAILLNWKNVEKFASLAEKMPSLKVIIASTHEMPEGTSIRESHDGITIISSDEILTLGMTNLSPPVPPKPTDTAVIMYTSGSTGKPKGVVMTHGQLVSANSGMISAIDVRPGKEVYVSYLPLAHILALQAEIGMLSNGCRVCYSGPRELVATLSLFRPTMHAGVPKVWELFKTGLEKKMAKAPPLILNIFQLSYEYKSFALSMGMETPLFNLFFRAVSKKLFGDRLRVGISGGGPLNKTLQEFCRVVFCIPLVQGYALTETCVGGTFQALDDPRPGVVGGPVSCIEIMLQSEPNIKDHAGFPYLHTDTKSSKGESVIGRGEICMRGPCISQGYYKLPEKTKADYDSDGWFHTGDIGQYTADGVIQIIDRKKNLVKLKGGEYVAIEAMESTFNSSDFVTAVCVIADGGMDRPLALVCVNKPHLKQWANEHKISYTSVDELAQMIEAKQVVLADMISMGKKAGLTKLETGLKDCALITTEWGPGNGMTATMKLDRKGVHKLHKNEIDALLRANS